MLKSAATTTTNASASRAGAMSRDLAVGLAVLAGAAVLDAALIPGMLLGAGAALGPRVLLSGRRRKAALARPGPARPKVGAQATAPGFAVGRAVAKTFTYQVVYTGVDFSAHLLALGDLAMAAGLSASHFVAGPLLYLPHETAWNYFAPAGTRFTLPAFSPGGRRTVVSRAVAKTATFRTVASVVEFTAHYVVIGNFVTAAALSAFGFVAGPFVYFGHEVAWDVLGSPARRQLAPPAAAPV